MWFQAFAAVKMRSSFFKGQAWPLKSEDLILLNTSVSNYILNSLSADLKEAIYLVPTLRQSK
jgi:hypothetical protein